MERAEKQFPTGSGEKFVEKRKELSLPAVEVANKVLWVNPAFKEAPFKLEKGRPSKLGLFFTGKIKPDSPDAVSQKQYDLSLMPEIGYGLGPMGRSGLIGEVIFSDTDGNLWRDVDVKGGGAFKKVPQKGGTYGHFTINKIDSDSEKEKTAYGLLDYGYALHDQEYSEKFLKAGIRTHRVVAIIEPKEIVDTSRMRFSIKEAKEMGGIPKSMHPVIEVRAFGTKERIMYLNHLEFKDRARTSVEDARLLVAQELGKKPNDFSAQEYAKWFAETLGRQVAKIRKLKLHHGYLQTHNITLDCRIVDLDSVTTAEEALEMKKGSDTWRNDLDANDLYQEDQNDAYATLVSFITALERLDVIEPNPQFLDPLRDKFVKAYSEELKAGEPKKQKKKTSKK